MILGLMLRAILFDFNGVLLDDEHLHLELFQRVLAQQGLDLTEEEYYRDYVGFDDEAGFSHAYVKAGRELSPHESTALCQRKAELYKGVVARGEVAFFPGSIELVREAAEAGLALGIVSGALQAEIELALERANITSLFRTIVAAEAVQNSKPDPEGYLLGVDRLQATLQGSEQLRANQVLAIEDTQAGLSSAKAAGLVAVAVEHTYEASHFEGAADYVAEKIADLRLSGLQELFLVDA